MSSTQNTVSTLTSAIQPLPTEERSKLLVQVPSTGRPLKGSKSMSGNLVEERASQKFHSSPWIPVLISPQLLRSRNLGQLDLARASRDQGGWFLEVAEVKSSQIGVQNQIYGQNKRISSSLAFLSSLLGMRGKFISLVG